MTARANRENLAARIAALDERAARFLLELLACEHPATAAWGLDLIEREAS